MRIPRDRFLNSIKIKNPMDPSDWADRYRYLSQASSSEPGIWRTSRTPYLKEIMNCLSIKNAGVRRIYVQKGHQLGYTEGILMNGIGWVISESPGPAMMVAPSEKAAKKLMFQKLDPMITDSPRVRSRVATNSRMSQRNTQLHKDFDGGFLVIAGATVPSDLAGASVKYLFLDEVDRMQLDTGGEGSPVELAIGRTSAYNRRKIIMGSTPTDEETSVISQYFLTGDQRYYNVPCPHCGFFQIIEFDQIKWNEDISKAWLECKKCKKPIHEKDKTFLLEKGKWIPQNPKADRSIRSYHISSLYSPVGFLSWIDCVKAHEKAQKDERYMQTFKNLYLGETCTLNIQDVPSPSRLYSLEKKPIEITGSMILTGGIDIQSDRIELLRIGWIKRKAFLIDHNVFYGQTNSDPWDEPWMELTSFIKENPIHMLAIDAGFIPHRVFSFYDHLNRPKNLKIIRGAAQIEGIISNPKFMEVTSVTGKKSKVGNKFYTLNTHILKQEIYSRLMIEDPRSDDYVSFPPGLSREFYEQLCSERLVPANPSLVMDREGIPRHKWIAIRQRNEALDLFVYSLGMYYSIGSNRYLEKWDEFVKIRNRVLRLRMDEIS